MNLINERLLLISPSSKQIVGKIEGNIDADSVLIFCHGFGVKSDSRGMFNDISDEFKTRYLTVKFQLTVIDSLKDESIVLNYQDQVEMIKTVIESVIKKYPEKKITILAHSQGCTVLSILLDKEKYNLEQVVLLAPFVRKNFIEKMKEKLLEREGSILNLNGTSKYFRTDGSTTLIPKEFWQGLDTLDTFKLFSNLDTKYNSYFVWANGDTKGKIDEYNGLKSLNVKRYVEIEGNHDFIYEGNREPLMSYLKEIL